MMPNKFVGIAKCAPEDTWDEHTGRMIAFDRAKFKYDKAFILASDNFIYLQNRYMLMMNQRFDKFIQNAADYHYDRQSQIDELIDPSNN